jgi:hypothetical protein
MRWRQGGIEDRQGRHAYRHDERPRNIQLKDSSGGVADITAHDVMRKSGVVDVVGRVLLLW